MNGRDDTVRFTDLNSLQELASMKLDEQPISVFAAGSISLVVCEQSGALRQVHGSSRGGGCQHG